MEMLESPLIHEIVGLARQMTLADCSALNFNQCFILPVEGMKMLGWVLAIIETMQMP